MKRLLLLLLCSSLLSLTLKATVHVVQVANFQFSPANINNVIVGDVIRWEWVSGSHTTSDDPLFNPGTSLPAGAATWDSEISQSVPSFEYTVTVAGTYHYWCVPHAPDMSGFFTASNPLPIKLSMFTATTTNGKATLQWKTELEQNTDYFSVCRSLNGTNYTEIGKIPAAGNSTMEKSYSFTDNNINTSKYYYYHLKVIDKDGRQEFSETKMVKGEGKTKMLILTISPNPISRPGHLMLTFSAARAGKMEVDVVDAAGRSIMKTQMQAFAGVNNGHVHLGNLAPGSYTIICVLDGTKESHKIIYKQ